MMWCGRNEGREGQLSLKQWEAGKGKNMPDLVYATMSYRYVYVKYCVFWVGCCITLSCIKRVSRFKQTSVWLKGLNVTTRETKLVSVRRCSVVTLSDDLGEKPLSYQMRIGENKSDTCCELVMLHHPAVIIHSYKHN